MDDQLSREDNVGQNTILEFVDPKASQCLWCLSQSLIKIRVFQHNHLFDYRKLYIDVAASLLYIL